MLVSILAFGCYGYIFKFDFIFFWYNLLRILLVSVFVYICVFI